MEMKLKITILLVFLLNGGNHKVQSRGSDHFIPRNTRIFGVESLQKVNEDNDGGEESGAFEDGVDSINKPGSKKEDVQEKKLTFKMAVEKVKSQHNEDNDGSPVGTDITSSFTKIQQKAEQLDEKLGKYSDAAMGAANGIIKMVSGITTNSWQDIVTGSLDMIGAVAGMLGPIGSVVSTVLSFFSSIIGLFGGPTGKKESQEDMMKRVVKAALEEAKNDELKAQIRGAKDMFGTVSDAINIFREEGSLTYDQALSFYEQSFQNIEIFGILEYYIDKWCAGVGTITDSNKQKAEDYAQYCLSICNLYADLSIYRQILLTDMASVIASAGLNGTSDVFLKLIIKEKKKDASIFKFFLDPVHDSERRYAIAKYYSEIHRYQTLTIYIKEIVYSDVRYQERVEYTKYLQHSPGMRREVKKTMERVKAMALLCNKRELQGTCYQISFSEFGLHDLNYFNFHHLKMNKGSFYISSGFKFTVGGLTYYGPSVYGVGDNFLSFSMFNSTLTAASERVRICKEESLGMKGECATLEIKTYTPKDLRNIGWYQNIKSVYVPEGILVTAYLNRYVRFRANIMYGPATYSKVSSTFWETLEIEPTEMKTNLMIKLCIDPYFANICIFIENKSKNYTVSNLKFYNHGFSRINSIKLPNKCKLIGKDKNKDVLGVYIGPAVVNQTPDLPNFEIKAL